MRRTGARLPCLNSNPSAPGGLFEAVMGPLRFSVPLLTTTALIASATLGPQQAPRWRFDIKQTPSGIVALESVIVSPTLALWFDGAANAPLKINNHSAWGALWDLQTSSVRPIEVKTQSFCASGARLSNGSMVRSLIPSVEALKRPLRSASAASLTWTYSLIILQPTAGWASASSSLVRLRPAKAVSCSRTRRIFTSRAPGASC